MHVLIIKRWQDRWVNSSNSRVAYGCIRDVSFVAETQDFRFSMSRDFLLTGHEPLNVFLHGRHLNKTASYECGKERKDWIHVLCECPMYTDIRDFGRMGVIRTDGQCRMWDVLICY